MGFSLSCMNQHSTVFKTMHVKYLQMLNRYHSAASTDTVHVCVSLPVRYRALSQWRHHYFKSHHGSVTSCLVTRPLDVSAHHCWLTPALTQNMLQWLYAFSLLCGGVAQTSAASLLRGSAGLKPLYCSSLCWVGTCIHGVLRRGKDS